MNSKNNTVCAVILTYNNRIDFVKAVVSRLFEQNVEKVIVVANGTSPELLLPLREDIRIEVLALEENKGSGQGYSIGIQAAQKTNCDFFWLLDDDNLPAPDCLYILQKVWVRESKSIQASKLGLSCYRDDQYEDKELNLNGNRLSIQPRINSYHGFHINRILPLVYGRFIKKHTKEVSRIEKGDICDIDGAFFGGFYFHRSMTDLISLPNDYYFLYADDLEYSNRVLQHGGKILMVYDAQIHSLHWSIPKHSRSRKLYHSTLDYEQPFRTYYCARNLEDFSRKHFVRNKPLYYLNLMVFVCTIGTLAVIRGRLSHFRLLVKGIVDSWKGRFGENTKINFKTR